MAEPQPGLRPIIPEIRRQPGPSPLIPVIVLVIIVILRWFFSTGLAVWDSFSVLDALDLGGSFDSVQSQLTFAAFLIPICLILAIQAFGIPQVNPARNAPPLSPIMNAIMQNPWSSLSLFFVLMSLLFSVSPTQFLPDLRPSIPAYANRGFQSGVCQELGILKRRCENWKGSSRDSVCRELAVLQKRCERGGF